MQPVQLQGTYLDLTTHRMSLTPACDSVFRWGLGDFGGEPRRPVWHRDLGPAPRHDRTSNHPVACLQLGSIARQSTTPSGYLVISR